MFWLSPISEQIDQFLIHQRSVTDSGVKQYVCIKTLLDRLHFSRKAIWLLTHNHLNCYHTRYTTNVSCVCVCVLLVTGRVLFSYIRLNWLLFEHFFQFYWSNTNILLKLSHVLIVICWWVFWVGFLSVFQCILSISALYYKLCCAELQVIQISPDSLTSGLDLIHWPCEMGLQWQWCYCVSVVESLDC